MVFTNIYKWKIYKWYSPRILKKRSKSRINVLCPVYNFDVMFSACDQIHPAQTVLRPSSTNSSISSSRRDSGSIIQLLLHQLMELLPPHSADTSSLLLFRPIRVDNMKCAPSRALCKINSGQTYIGGSKGPLGTSPPVQFLSFSYSFRQKSC